MRLRILLTKPEPQTTEYWDYNDCYNYIIEKYGIKDDHRFWSFICDTCDPYDGKMIYLPYTDQTNHIPNKIILGYLGSEFGQGPYLVKW